MIWEKSCGAVIFRADRGKREYLVEWMRRGNVSMCKGHVEGNENEHETATREIREETGISVTYIPGFREKIRYSPYSGCMKNVIFFLAQAKTTDTTPQACEVTEIRWLPLEEALSFMTHESDREVLRLADTFLSKQEEKSIMGTLSL